MASVTNLDGLFEMAAADWNFIPPPLPSGGTAPQVEARAISLIAGMRLNTTGGDPFKISGGLYEAKLNCSPARKIPGLHALPLLVPASFSGDFFAVPPGLDATELFCDISPAGAGGYNVSIKGVKQSSGSAPNPPITVVDNLAPPGGQQGNSNDPLLNVSFTAAGSTIELSQYSFVMTFKKV